MEKYKQKEIEYENQIADFYNQWYHQSYIEKEIDKSFVRFLKMAIKKGDRVLDLGCGPASLWPELSKIKGIELIGVDISPKMIAAGKKLFPNGEFKVGDSENIPAKDKTFNVVICSSVLHHLPKTNRSFKEIKRVLKDDGILLGREPQTEQFIFNTKIWVRRIYYLFQLIAQKKIHYFAHEEPAIHEYHRTFKIKVFINEVKKHFQLDSFESKFPFSSLFTKITDVGLSKKILSLDESLKYFNGNQFFYKAISKTGEEKTQAESYLTKLFKNTQKIPLDFVMRLIGLTLLLLLSPSKK